MMDVAYQLLVQQLQAFCPIPPVNTGQRGIFAAPAFLYAWSVIDNAHRLVGLVKNFPRFSKKRQVPELRLFLEHAETVEKLRNAIQHFDGTIRQSAPQGYGVWGSLSWMFRADDENVLTCFLTLGALMPAAEIGDSVPQTLKLWIEGVKLKRGQTSVNLSELMVVTSTLAAFFESALEQEFGRSTSVRAESDYFLAIAMKRGANNTLFIPATDSGKSA